MSSTVTFYTNPMHDMLRVESNNDAGTLADARANLFDENLNTYWQASDVASYKEIDIDTTPTGTSPSSPQPSPVEAETINSFGFWIKDYKTDHDEMRVEIKGSHEPDFTNTYNLYQTQYTILHRDNPLWFDNIYDPGTGLATTANYRYYRIVFIFSNPGYTPTTAPQISQIFLCNKITLNKRPDFPIMPDEVVYPTQSVELTSGNQRVSQLSENNYKILNRNFTLIDTDKADLLEVYSDSFGSFLPVIYQEGTNIEDAYVVRLQQQKPSITEVDHQFYKAKVAMQSLPYIDDGDTI
jgi:hypothetical protein